LIPPKTKFSLDKILLATDGSENSNIALEEALRAAQVCQSTLTVVSVIKPGLTSEYRQKAEKIIEEARKKASGKNIPVEAQTLQGEPWEKIVEFAEKHDINVIMLGRHGETGLKKLLVGSVAERVAGHAPCAVVVVPS
jgi:nucleotide-binding universal stress UspA family protein